MCLLSVAENVALTEAVIVEIFRVWPRIRHRIRRIARQHFRTIVPHLPAVEFLPSVVIVFQCVPHVQSGYVEQEPFADEHARISAAFGALDDGEIKQRRV